MSDGTLVTGRAGQYTARCDLCEWQGARERAGWALRAFFERSAPPRLTATSTTTTLRRWSLRMPDTDEYAAQLREHADLWKFHSDERGFVSGRLDALLAEREAMKQRIAAAMALHQPMGEAGREPAEVCQTCDEEVWDWPCATVRALQGDSSDG